MVVYNDFLDKFFKIEIFDLDDDDILLILGGYSHSDIIYHLNKILELNGLLLPNNLEASWKIGRIFGACRQVGIDDIIISKIIISPNNLK
ncbi:MAG: hypothetical protein I8H98_08740, partial [Moraxellaceae bacterium]|nr:hypothetical protein [Moraxellaceae bacterium]